MYLPVKFDVIYPSLPLRSKSATNDHPLIPSPHTQCQAKFFRSVALHPSLLPPGVYGLGAARPTTQRRGLSRLAALPGDSAVSTRQPRGAPGCPVPRAFTARSCPTQAPPSSGTVQVAGICAFWFPPTPTPRSRVPSCSKRRRWSIPPRHARRDRQNVVR